MDFPMHVDRLNMEFPIVNFKGSQVEISICHEELFQM